jgi:hypothetical protein
MRSSEVWPSARSSLTPIVAAKKRLRKLEQRLLAAGVQVARTGEDLVRYHGKVMLVDDTLYVLGFNYTRLDAERSRSFGLIAKDNKLVKSATELFECDASRQPFTPGTTGWW